MSVHASYGSGFTFYPHTHKQVSFSFVARKGSQEQAEQPSTTQQQDFRWDESVGVGIPADVWLNGLQCPAHRYPHSDEKQPEGVDTSSSVGSSGSEAAARRERAPDAKPLLASGWPEVSVVMLCFCTGDE